MVAYRLSRLLCLRRILLSIVVLILTGHVNTATHFLDFNSRIPAGPRTTFYTIGTAYFAYCWTLFIPGEPPGYLSLLASRGKFLPIVTGKG